MLHQSPRTSRLLIAASLLIPTLTRAADVIPLEKSPIVAKSADGSLGVAEKNGTPINGVKLSQHDTLILPPHIAVTSDGVIHVAFTEQSEISPYSLFVYHRQSADGGKTWSDAKNLSEDMPNVPVGPSNLLVDGSDRLYVIWRAGLKEGFPVTLGQSENLLYRVLDHGKWSKIIPVHPPGSAETQDDGSYFSFAAVDPAGHAQVVWNTCPDKFIPAQVMGKKNPSHLFRIGNGLVFQATLDGSKPSAPRQVYMSTVVQVTPYETDKAANDLSALDGYVDSTGNPHFIAIDRPATSSDQSSQISLIENGKAAPAIKLPSPYMEVWSNPPKLLLDSKGHQHIIALYDAGEHPSFRDYTVGSDDEPVVILSPKTPKGTCLSFQAFQGPTGHMAVIMQTTDRGYNDAGDSFLSLSSGDSWSTPVCITNNAARAKFAGKQIGASGGVSTFSHFGPGPGALTFDKDGHPLLAICNIKTGSFALASGGAVYAGGSSSTPMLFFYKF